MAVLFEKYIKIHINTVITSPQCVANTFRVVANAMVETVIIGRTEKRIRCRIALRFHKNVCRVVSSHQY